jgi:hypothetical protein
MNERHEDFPEDDPFDTKEFKPEPEDGLKPPGGGKGKPSPIKLNWHGENIDDPLVNWLVDQMFYQEGVALIVGQWGTFKTFVAVDLAVSVMTMTPFAGRAVHRQGGVLFIAAEGQEQVRVRLQGAALGKVAQIEPEEDAAKIDPAKMPFVWTTRSPPLSDPKSATELRAVIDDAAAGMRERFDLPLALIVIDALMQAAQFGDADKTTEARQVMDMLAAIGREFNVLVIPVDHFGKDVSTGTRNSSAKEDAAETILALLGERSLEGKLSNPRMALRKVKGAEQGVEFPFEPRLVTVGERDDGRPITTYVIDWQSPADQTFSIKKQKPWPTSLRIFQRALDKTLGDRGKRIRPFADGPEVLATPVEAVRTEFLKAHPGENKESRAKAFKRALIRADEVGLICAREIEGAETFVWRMDVK